MVRLVTPAEYRSKSGGWEVHTTLSHVWPHRRTEYMHSATPTQFANGPAALPPELVFRRLQYGTDPYRVLKWRNRHPSVITSALLQPQMPSSTSGCFNAAIRTCSFQ
jgi:hypothetical protein